MDARICRLCYLNVGKYYIFAKDEEIPRSIKIKYCCSRLKLVEGDGLPAHICDDCNEEISRFYCFTQKCEEADKKLRLLKKIKCELPDIQIKTEVDESNKDIEIRHELKSEDDSDAHENEFNNEQNDWNGKIETSDLNDTYTNESDKDHKSEYNIQVTVERQTFDDVDVNVPIVEIKEGNFLQGDKSQVKRRVRRARGSAYTCTICSKKFTQMRSKLRHEKRHTEEKNVTCFICNKFFYTKQDLHKHSIVHSAEKKYACHICNAPFKYKNNLKKHVKRHIEPEKFICNHCGWTFTVKGNLERHISNQHSTKSGYCDICSKDMPNIDAHILIHKGIKLLKCRHCAKSYTDKNALANHIHLRHQFPGKHKCKINGCNLSFLSLPMVDFHISKDHRSEIPFPCDLCPRGFFRKTDLSRHKLGTHKV